VKICLNTVPCHLCGTPLRTEKVSARAVAYEPWVTPTDGLLKRCVLHSEDRCRFAALIAVSDFNEENSG
jgi:hypothetical protein